MWQHTNKILENSKEWQKTQFSIKHNYTENPLPYKEPFITFTTYTKTTQNSIPEKTFLPGPWLKEERVLENGPWSVGNTRHGGGYDGTPVGVQMHGPTSMAQFCTPLITLYLWPVRWTGKPGRTVLWRSQSSATDKVIMVLLSDSRAIIKCDRERARWRVARSPIRCRIAAEVYGCLAEIAAPILDHSTSLFGFTFLVTL